MKSAEFTNLLQHPQKITDSQTEAIQSVIEAFPYCQPARAIYLKGLKNKDSFNYNQALKTTACYTTDRSILFDYITSEAFLQNEISEQIKKNLAHLKDIEVEVEDISIQRSVTIDDALKQQIKDTTGVLDPELFQPKNEQTKPTAFDLDQTDSIDEFTEEEDTETIAPDEILNLGKPLQFDMNERHSFNEWLKLTRFKPIDRNEVLSDKEEPSHDIRDRKFDLIDKFIATNPKIDPVGTGKPNINLAEEYISQPNHLMTETLARIYVEQKNYEKAIQSYKILSLKYPEKSGFFADQIKAVEHLQEKNNKA